VVVVAIAIALPMSSGELCVRSRQAPRWSPPAGRSVFRLRIQLEHVTLPIWRRLLVPGSVRLNKLSEMLLVAMDREGRTPMHFE
jgi:hypothetical protein